jgi:hypothetical protein
MAKSKQSTAINEERKGKEIIVHQNGDIAKLKEFMNKSSSIKDPK